MGSADFSRQTVFDHGCECFITLPCPWDLPGYSHVLSHLYLPRLLLAFRAVIGLWFVLQPYPRFTAYPDNFYRPVVCLQLPSDPTSRWRPCLWLHPSHCRAGQGLSPFRTCARRAHNEMAIDIITITITFPKSNTFYYNIKFNIIVFITFLFLVFFLRFFCFLPICK